MENQDKWVEIQKTARDLNQLREEEERFAKKAKKYEDGQINVFVDGLNSDRLFNYVPRYIVGLAEKEIKQFMPFVLQKVQNKLRESIQEQKDELIKLVSVVENE